MEFQEYPKRVYKGDESIIANTVEEEWAYCISKGIRPEHLTQEPIDEAIRKYEENYPIPIGGLEGIEDKIFGVKSNDKENKEGVSSEIGKGEESKQAEFVQETSEGASCGSGNVQTHEGQEGTIGILTTCEDLQKVTGLTKDEIVLANKMAENVPKIIRRKPGRPKKREMDEQGFVPK